MRVLVLHPAASFGGASKSLCEFASQAIAMGIELHVICPRGNAADAFASIGMHVHLVRGLSQLDNTRYGHYRGLRWLLLLRELAFLPSSVRALMKVRRIGRFDLLHINEITLLPLGLLAKKLFGLPLVVHVRSLQNNSGTITNWINQRLKSQVDAVVAIDESVKRTLPTDLSVHVVHNGLKVEGTNHSTHTHIFRVGIVGLLLKLKGVYEFVEAARILLIERNIQAEFWLVGENARPLLGFKGWLLRKFDFARDVRKELAVLIKQYGLEDSVFLKGFQSDVQSVYRQLDVLCFPSYLNAAGRPVFEAAFFGVPSIVAVRDAPPDTILNGSTGVCIDTPDPIALADAIEFLYRHPEERLKMGENALNLAHNNFDIVRNANHLLMIYRRLAMSCSSNGNPRNF